MIVLSVLGLIAAWLGCSTIAVVWVIYTYLPGWWATVVIRRDGR
jgi:hypothetical protein